MGRDDYFITNSGGHLAIGQAPHITGLDIQKFRRIRGIPQQVLARHLGCSVRTLRKWEALGDFPIPDKNAAREIKSLRGYTRGYGQINRKETYE